jgi:hypothetical protein
MTRSLNHPMNPWLGQEIMWVYELISPGRPEGPIMPHPESHGPGEGWAQRALPLWPTRCRRYGVAGPERGVVGGAPHPCWFRTQEER